MPTFTFEPITATPCPVCTHRATAYGLGPCDAHSDDVWAGAR